MSPGNPFILGSSVKGQGHKTQKAVLAGLLRYCGFCLS